MTTTCTALLTALLAGASIVASSSSVLQYIAVGTGTISGIASVVSTVIDFASRAANAANCAKESALLAAKWRVMLTYWECDQMGTIYDYAQRQKLLESAAFSGDVPYSEKLNDEASDVAYKRVLAEIHGVHDDDDEKVSAEATNAAAGAAAAGS